MFRNLIRTPNDPVALVVRLGLAVMIFGHGAQKVLGWFGGPGLQASMTGFVQNFGLPAPIAALAIWTELIGGILLFVGLLGRLAALAVGIEMVVAALMVHLPNGFFMNWAGNQAGEGFEFHILAVTSALAVVIRGSGAWSVDQLLSRSWTPTGQRQPIREPAELQRAA
jgi:putative oxidoreductase